MWDFLKSKLRELGASRTQNNNDTTDKIDTVDRKYTQRLNSRHASHPYFHILSDV
jgi:hypothetical protein